jgi:hypothetical protein
MLAVHLLQSADTVAAVPVTRDIIGIAPDVLWFLLALGFVVVFHQRIATVFDALAVRVQSGAPIEAFGVSIGTPPPGLGVRPNQVATSEGVGGERPSTEAAEQLGRATLPDGVTRDFALVHEAQTLRPRSSKHPGLWRVRLSLEGYPDSAKLPGVRSVTYHLDDTFAEPLVSTSDATQQFELWMNIYGEINVLAYVERNNAPPLWLSRLINLPGRPPD